ncbi:ATP-binding cassette domain-containing protein [Xenorhabdus sp. IM139775]|uniref:ATP-binding cassette domain-containing protein n=1 Tax=Xenorhabdus sp. IM139775 TaxID=3025876 RepID=UPI002358682F|nr:ATP-binding cassette domain-containing protein [Xenorhabdus sp. IM139775]MDC9593772.1 ATP-binding cassette domain-containing protein [Xenorhabdus sp. IM139775]
MLATRALHFSYQDEPVLKDLTLDFGRHQVTGIIGANGCGKSTLLMTLSGILRPQKGAVWWNNTPLDYSKKGLMALRQQVVTVFQDPDQQIFYTDIDSDLAFSLRNLGVDETEIQRRIDDALTRVDAQAFRHKPIQYLSFGQKKRVAIAGALVMEFDYLLLDEPTAGLDPAGRQQMLAMISMIAAEGKRIIISSHDIDLIYQICDGLYVLANGEMISSGSPKTVLLQKNRLEQAGLAQPWLVKVHSEAGLPLCQTEAEFFSVLRTTDRPKPDFLKTDLLKTDLLNTRPQKIKENTQ